MFTSLSGELNELAIYEAGYQLSLFDSLLPDFVLMFTLWLVSLLMRFTPLQWRDHSRDDCSVSGPQILAGGSAQTHNKNTVRQGFCWGIPMSRSQEKFGEHISKGGFQD